MKFFVMCGTYSTNLSGFIFSRSELYRAPTTHRIKTPRFERALAIGPVDAHLPRPRKAPRPPVALEWSLQLKAARGARR